VCADCAVFILYPGSDLRVSVLLDREELGSDGRYQRLLQPFLRLLPDLEAEPRDGASHPICVLVIGGLSSCSADFYLNRVISVRQTMRLLS